DFAGGTCSMNLSVIYPNDGSPGAKTVPHTCGFAGLHAYGDMIVTLSPLFSQLTDGFKTDMDGCIAEAEAAFPH
ncbi:MAG TPA: hypothetical protein VIF62_07200, partial [Labilithrix sp.]